MISATILESGITLNRREGPSMHLLLEFCAPARNVRGDHRFDPMSVVSMGSGKALRATFLCQGVVIQSALIEFSGMEWLRPMEMGFRVKARIFEAQVDHPDWKPDRAFAAYREGLEMSMWFHCRRCDMLLHSGLVCPDCQTVEAVMDW